MRGICPPPSTNHKHNLIWGRLLYYRKQSHRVPIDTKKIKLLCVGLVCCRPCPCIEFGIDTIRRVVVYPLVSDVVDAVQFPQHTRGDRIGLNAPSFAHESTFSFLQELWLCATLPFASSTHNFPSGEVRNQLINIYISVSLEPSRSETPHLTADCGQLTSWLRIALKQ